MTVLLGSLQAAPFLYRRLRMCIGSSFFFPRFANDILFARYTEQLHYSREIFRTSPRCKSKSCDNASPTKTSTTRAALGLQCWTCRRQYVVHGWWRRRQRYFDHRLQNAAFAFHVHNVFDFYNSIFLSFPSLLGMRGYVFFVSGNNSVIETKHRLKPGIVSNQSSWPSFTFTFARPSQRLVL